MGYSQDLQNNDIPTQESATDTSNQDTKISYDIIICMLNTSNFKSKALTITNTITKAK